MIKEKYLLEVYDVPSEPFNSSLYTFLKRYVLKGVTGNIRFDLDIYYREEMYMDEYPDILFGLYDAQQKRIIGSYAYGMEAYAATINFYNGDLDTYDEMDYILAIALHDLFRESYIKAIPKLIESEDEEFNEPEENNSQVF